MSLTTPSRIYTYVIPLASLVLCLLPGAVSAQPPNAPDLSVENLSVFSTLPESGGFRRVSISFIVVNRSSSATAGATTTRVIIGNGGFSFGTPGLKPNQVAYISRSLRTQATQLSISVVADAFHNIPGEQDVDNNELKYEANLRSEPGRWISIGPSKIRDASNTFGPVLGVGRVTSLVVDPRSPDIVYLGARGSGIWKRNGSLWFPIGDSLPSLQIDAIGIYPRNPDRVVVATPMGVFESMDGGGVWSLLTSQNLNALGSGGGALLIENSDRPAMYVSTKSGVLVSTDNGRNWTTVLRPGSRVFSLQFSTTDPTHLLASTTDPPLVFEGKDRGLTPNSWKILTGCVAPLPLPFAQNSNVWITESRGRRWVSIRDKDAGKAEIWRSTNRICQLNGFTEHAWEKVSLSGDCAKHANHFSYLFAHPTDPLILFKGGIQLCRSEARGDAFKKVQKIHVDHHAIAVAPSDPSLMYFGTDGGIYRSTDKGKTMEFIGEGLNNTEFFKIDVDGRSPAVVVGGSQDQFTSTWDGISPIWKLVSGGGVDLTDTELVAFDRSDRKGIYEIAQSTRQVRLLRPGGGQTRLGDSELPDCCAAEASGTVRNSMASTGGSPRLLITCQGIWAGPPWRRIQEPSLDTVPSGCFNATGDFERLKLHPSGILVAVTNSGQVFHGFFKFPPLRKVFQPVTPASPSAISFDGPGRFYIATNSTNLSTIDRFDCFLACNRERIFSTNRGTITAMTIDSLVPDTVVAAVRNQGVVRGTRTGTGLNNWSWTSYSNGLPAGAFVTDLQTRANGAIVAATFGRGAFQAISRIAPRPSNPEARGRVTLYENERVFPDQPPGPGNPVVENIELDSRPGFVFTSSSRFPRFAAIVRRAIERNRTVTIVFVPLNVQTGTIISVR